MGASAHGPADPLGPWAYGGPMSAKAHGPADPWAHVATDPWARGREFAACPRYIYIYIYIYMYIYIYTNSYTLL